MSTLTTKDDVQIFHKDWGHGQPVVFHDGAPLSADDWDSQLLFFVQRGYHAVGIDLAKAVLMSAVPPIIVKSPDNPTGMCRYFLNRALSPG